jgi:hypothetical protein
MNVKDEAAMRLIMGELHRDVTYWKTRAEYTEVLLRIAREELDCPKGEVSGVNVGHRCINCDEHVDRNRDLRQRIDKLLADIDKGVMS